MVWPSPAAWQVRSAQRHFGGQQWDGDQAPQRGDNPTPDHLQRLRTRPTPRTLPPQQRQSTRCLARTVQLLYKKRTRQERFNNNARPLTTVASASSSPYSSSTTTIINPLPGKDCAVVVQETHAARKVQQQCKTTDNSCERVLLPVLFLHNNDNQPAAWQGLCSCCRRNARGKKQGSTTTQ